MAQTSSRSLDHKLRKPLGKLGVKVKEKVKNLGVHFVARKKHKGFNAEAAKRYQAGLKQVRRAQRFGRAPHFQAYRSLLIPSFTFGASAVSCPTALIKALRTQTAKTFGAIEGRSTTVRLLLENSDVRQVITLKTIMAWISAVWEELVDLQVMQLAWKHASAQRGSAAAGNKGTHAGAAAYLEALQQVGWQSPSVHSVRTRQGHTLYFGKGPAPSGTHAVDPAFLKTLASDEYESTALENSKLAEELTDLSGKLGYPHDDKHARALDENAQATRTERVDIEKESKAISSWRRGRFECYEDGPIPWLWPVHAVMRAARRHGLRKEAASIRALAEGGWPTQVRLYCHRRADHVVCRCGEALGTLRHKLGSCTLADSLRQQECPEWLQDS